MTDTRTTIDELKSAILKLVKAKGWGDENGVQNPQHVAMAMSVEMAELLEHFEWMDEAEVKALLRGEKPEKTAAIAEEFADVMMYGLQLTACLGIDVSAQIERKIGIVEQRPKHYKKVTIHTEVEG